MNSQDYQSEQATTPEVSPEVKDLAAAAVQGAVAGAMEAQKAAFQYSSDPIVAAVERLQEQCQRQGIRMPKATTPAPAAGGLAANMQRERRRHPLRRATDKAGYPIARRNDPQRVDTVIKKSAHKNDWTRRLAVARMLNDWADVVGPQIAEHTESLRFEKGILYVECDSTAWATMLRNMQSQVIAHIAKEIGDDVVTALKCYGPKPPSWRHGKLHVKGRGPRDTYG